VQHQFEEGNSDSYDPKRKNLGKDFGQKDFQSKLLFGKMVESF